MNRYRWATYDLGRADEQFVLDVETADALRSRRRAGASHGAISYTPLAGVFRVDQPDALYSRSGYLDPDDGRFVVRTFSDRGSRGLRVWFEPHGSAPHSSDCRLIGVLPAASTIEILSQAVIDAIDGDPADVTFRSHTPPAEDDAVTRAERHLIDLERRHNHLVDQIADPEVSPRAATKLKTQSSELEVEMAAVEEKLDDLRRAAQARPKARLLDATFQITDLAELLAVIGIDRRLPPEVASRAARLLGALLPDAAVVLRPATGTIDLRATLVLNNDDGQLRVPLNVSLPNEAKDTWVAGIAGRWWHRHLPMSVLFAERGLKTNPSTSTRWREPIVTRLMAEASAVGRELPDAATAGLLARAPTPELIRAAVEYVTAAAPSDPVLAARLAEAVRTARTTKRTPLWTDPHWRSLLP